MSWYKRSHEDLLRHMTVDELTKRLHDAWDAIQPLDPQYNPWLGDPFDQNNPPRRQEPTEPGENIYFDESAKQWFIQLVDGSGKPIITQEYLCRFLAEENKLNGKSVSWLKVTLPSVVHGVRGKEVDYVFRRVRKTIIEENMRQGEAENGEAGRAQSDPSAVSDGDTVTKADTDGDGGHKEASEAPRKLLETLPQDQAKTVAQHFGELITLFDSLIQQKLMQTQEDLEELTGAALNEHENDKRSEKAADRRLEERVTRFEDEKEDQALDLSLFRDEVKQLRKRKAELETENAGLKAKSAGLMERIAYLDVLEEARGAGKCD
jgi:hypothetical protein